MEQPQPHKTPGPERTRASGALASILCSAALLAGCWTPTTRAEVATPAARAELVARPSSLLTAGRASERDAIVRIVAGKATCTGTLIADDRVLTAHHCVSARDARGRMLPRTRAPGEIQVELGGEDLPWGEVGVRAVIAPDCGYVSGDGDIAILVLDRHLIGMPISSVRLDAPPEKKEWITVHGFGRCALSRGGIHRRSRDAGKVVCTDPQRPDTCHNEGIESVSAGHFEIMASICPGDSGGPVYNSRGEIIGVISASVMDGDEDTPDRSFFTRVDVWRQLFSAAHEISLGASPSELPPYGDCHVAAPPKPKP